jgi:hypothetical protein
LPRVQAPILQLFDRRLVSRCHLYPSLSQATGGATPAACPVLIVQSVELIAVMFVLLILALATLPMWPYSSKWTYYPAGGCGLAVTLIAFLTLGGLL